MFKKQYDFWIEIINFQINWMDQAVPLAHNKMAITAALRETLPNRRQEVMQKKMFAAEILTKYPRLKDFDGEMVIICIG